MAAAMGFSSFGAQNPPSRKRKYNPNNDAVISIDDAQRHGTGANSAAVGERRARPSNADEIDLDDGDDDGAGNNGDTAAPETAGSVGAGVDINRSHGTGVGIAGLPQRPAPTRGGFAGNQHQRSGATRHASDGHYARNKLWYVDYYDHFSNENPWAKLEEAAGLQPISTWSLDHTNREGTRQTQAA